MKIASMLNDVFRSLFKRPFTERYPFEVKPAPERTRGRVEWDGEKCTGCMMCSRDCPAQAIEVEVVDRAAKKFIFHYRTDRCIYCAQCVVSCRPGALSMSNEKWHLASTGKEPFFVVYGKESAGRAPRTNNPPA
jgi:formate hydrogenlyase subunit 6/NADH:ubiquinone oxidoreductase subunit I